MARGTSDFLTASSSRCFWIVDRFIARASVCDCHERRGFRADARFFLRDIFCAAGNKKLRCDRWDAVRVLQSRNVHSQKTRARFDLTLGHLFLSVRSLQSFTDDHRFSSRNHLPRAANLTADAKRLQGDDSGERGRLRARGKCDIIRIHALLGPCARGSSIETRVHFLEKLQTALPALWPSVSDGVQPIHPAARSGFARLRKVWQEFSGRVNGVA
jgi:hypothetical protein